MGIVIWDTAKGFFEEMDNKARQYESEFALGISRIFFVALAIAVLAVIVGAITVVADIQWWQAAIVLFVTLSIIEIIIQIIMWIGRL